MSVTIILNIGSLLLGLFAWTVPILAMKYPVKTEIKKYIRFSIISFSACIASLCLQLFEINHRVQIQDFSALMDTMGTIIWIAVVLAVITIMLNVMALGTCCKKETNVGDGRFPE